MKKLFTFFPGSNAGVTAGIMLALFSILSFGATAQILSYTTATSGALNSVSANATGTSLALVNGATTPGSPCGTGFSSANFSSTTTYSSSLAAIEVTCTPNSGYTLNVTGFSAGLRRSASGPADVRFAYSTDGGTTWTNQGSNQSPDNASCGTTTTGTWTTSVTATSTLKFRVYGFDASSTAGTFQILNLTINGTVTGSGGGGGTSKIKYYFNKPVDTSVNTGTYAVYLDTALDDTLVAYISRAKYSIDIAQYEYSQTTAYANIANAVNSAYARGVVVRWIYCAAGTNTGLSALNSGIHTLSSPAAGSISPCSKEYNIMHDKFVLIDANSSNPNDALVWTGSPDWNADMFNHDFNNVVILQDSALAHAYTAQFNLMWGSTTATPNPSASLWGPCKPNSGHHIFTIGGLEVELYFTPSDSTNAHILSTIQTANTDLYFGMYTFTDVPDASQIVTEHIADGVTVDGIVDEYSTSYAAYDTLNTRLGTSLLKVYSGGAYIYHNKYVIVDPSNTCSDPMVLTGSHNWTASADLENDENTLIIHDATAANIYYQAFKGDFNSLGGTLSHISVGGGCGTTYRRPGGIAENGSTTENENSTNIFPNPTNGGFTIQYATLLAQSVSISITNIVGQQVAMLANNEIQVEGSHQYNFTPATPGIYLVHFNIDGNNFTKKVVKM